MKKRLFGVIFILILFFSTHKSSFAQGKVFYVFDARLYNGKTSENYNILVFLGTLQGIVNKENPKLYVVGHHQWEHYNTYRYNFNTQFEGKTIDLFWLEKFRQPGGWLANYQVITLNSLDEVINTFKDYFPKGIVVWDESIPATVNVATTIAGVEDTPVIRYDTNQNSLYTKLTQQLNIPVFLSLAGKYTGSGIIPDTNIPSTGSIKNDPYIWALEKYLKTGKTNPQLLGYFEDYSSGPLSNYASSRDYLVKNRAFVFDLSPYPNEPPCDDPNQSVIGGKPLDRRTFETILEANLQKNGEDKISSLYGFLPWWSKYGNYQYAGVCRQTNYNGVDGEIHLVEIISRYNTFLDAQQDLIPSNVSFHSWGPKPERLIQNSKPLLRNLENKTYVSFMVGDFDAPDNVYYFLTPLWDSRNNPSGRGSVPISYNIDPYLVDRFPQIIKYFYDTKSSLDFFAANEYGSGYIHPNAVDTQGRITAWRDFNINYFRELNYSITAYGLDEDKPTSGVYNAYRAFSGDGMRMTISRPKTPFPVLREERPENHLEGRMPVMYGTNTGWGVQNYRKDGETAEQALQNAVRDVSRGIISDLETPNNQDSYQNLGNRPNFLAVKIVWPDSYEFFDKLYEELKRIKPAYKFEAVDIYTFFYLYRQHLGGNNNYRATFVNDNLPNQLEAGKKYQVSVEVRNDGWDTWQGKDPNPYVLASWFYRGNQMALGTVPPAECQNNDPFFSCRYTRINGTVTPGQRTVFNMEITAPPLSGNYIFHYDMIQNEITTFQNQDNLAYEKSIKVIAATETPNPPLIYSQCLCPSGLNKLETGDANCDGINNIIDFGIWSNEFIDFGNRQLDRSLWRSDFNCDQIIDIRDFEIWRNKWTGN